MRGECSNLGFRQVLEENERLKVENFSLSEKINSKRFRFGTKVADFFNFVFPVGSPQRKVYTAISEFLERSRRKSDFKKNRRIVWRDMKKYDTIIVMCTILWKDKLRQRPHHLAKCLANNKNVFVVYFEPGEVEERYRKLSDNFITVNSWEVILSFNVSRKNAFFFFNNVSDINPILIDEVVEKGYRVVYEYIDEFHEDISGTLKNQLKIWKKLPAKKPIVLASATKLFNHAKAHFPSSKVVLSKNAVMVDDFNYNNFKKTASPKDLKSILKEKKPIVGYYGAIAPWLDYNLISKVAKLNKDLIFVFIGVNYQNALRKLDVDVSNVYYLGPKQYSELPKYSKFFDCAIIPFRKGEIAKGTSPVKMFEYMAMGLPIVGTRDLLECKGFEYVYLASNAEEFSLYINEAIKEHRKEKVKRELLKQAQENTWEARAEDIIRELKKNK